MLLLLLANCASEKQKINPAYLLLLAQPEPIEFERVNSQYCGRNCDWQNPAPIKDWDEVTK